MDTYLPRIPEFYAGKSIFITGGTGFLGKTLIEKLLRSCSELDTIYIIVRSKRNLSPEDRWKQSKDDLLFDRLKAERPHVLEDKVHVLEGDVKQPKLGLSDEDIRLLQDKVSFIYHVAANVRFNEPFNDAVLMNVRGTREVANLALDCKHLQMLIHVSTTFSNCYQLRAEEKVYPPPMEWKTAIKIAENVDKNEVHIVENKIICGFSNTYTYTKNLAEACILEYSDKVPSIIIRPSVMPTVEEPFAGWTDNINGHAGVAIAWGKGICRTTLTGVDKMYQVIGVDETAQALIVGTWYNCIRQRSGRDVPVYNVTCPEKGFTEVFTEYGYPIILKQCPLKNMLWHPRCHGIYTTSTLEFKINSVLFHLLPALVVDRLVETFKLPPVNLLKYQILYRNAIMAIKHFSMNEWDFPNHNFRKLQREVLPEDLPDFSTDYRKIDLLTTIINNCYTCTRRLLKEETDEQYYEESRIILNRMYWLDVITKNSLTCLLIWILSKWVMC